MPRIEKMAKKKNARPIIPLSYDKEAIRVPINNFMDGMVAKLLRGRNNLKVLKPLTPSIPGKFSRSEVTTTVKSNQFHASLR
jgi:hypothetical protein